MSDHDLADALEAFLQQLTRAALGDNKRLRFDQSTITIKLEIFSEEDGEWKQGEITIRPKSQ